MNPVASGQNSTMIRFACGVSRPFTIGFPVSIRSFADDQMDLQLVRGIFYYRPEITRSVVVIVHARANPRVEPSSQAERIVLRASAN
jgi:hypothetical protein